MKPGFTTTEFWTTILTHVVSIVLLFNTHLNSDKLSTLIPVAALIASGAAQAFYSNSRAKAKAAALAAEPLLPFSGPFLGNGGV